MVELSGPVIDSVSIIEDSNNELYPGTVFCGPRVYEFKDPDGVAPFLTWDEGDF